MSTAARALALRYARDILRRLPENANLPAPDLNLRAARLLRDRRLIALAEINLARSAARVMR